MKKLISMVVCAALLCLMFCACGAEGPDKVLAKQLDTLISGNFADGTLLGEDSTLTDEDSAMGKAMFGKMEYKVGKTTVDGETATVAVSITTEDVSTVFQNYFTEAMSHLEDADWDADGSRFVEMISAEDAPMTSFDITVNMVKTDGVWTVAEDGNDDLLNAVTGGFYQYLTDLTAAVG